MGPVKVVVNPSSPTFERNKDLFPRLRQAYVSDDEDEREEVTRARLRRYHSAQSLRSTAHNESTKHWNGQLQSRRRTASHNSAPSTPPRMTKMKTTTAPTAPSSPTRRHSTQQQSFQRTRLRAEPPLRKMRSFDTNMLRTHLRRTPSNASTSSSSRRSVSSGASLSSSASSASSAEEDFLSSKRALKLPLPDKAKALAHATEAFQFGLIAFGAAVAMWTLFAVLFASYGLTALDSFTSSTKWIAKYAPTRRKSRTVAENSSAPVHPPRPPMTSLVPTLMFTLLVWGGSQAASLRIGRRSRSSSPEPATI